MRTTALLVLGAMAAIAIAVLLVQPRALRKEKSNEISSVDISHPPTSTGSTTFITAPHIAPDAKAAAAH